MAFPVRQYPDLSTRSLEEFKTNFPDLSTRSLNSNSPMQGLVNQIEQYIPKTQNTTADFLPPGLNVTTGLMSALSKNPEQRDIIANLPQIAAGVQPTSGELTQQAVGRALPQMMLPESKAGGLIGPISRIGQQAGLGGLLGTDTKEGALQSGGFQAGIEALKTPFKAISQIAELMHPSEYAARQMKKVESDASSAKQLMNQKYNYTLNNVGDDLLTVDPKNYLGLSKKQINKFSPDMKVAYDNFLEKGNLRSLHNFQSSAGEYYAKIANNPNKPHTAAIVKDVREYANKKINSFLKLHPDELKSYEEGRAIGRDLYYPYLTGSTLTKVTKGVKQGIEPEQFAKAIKSGQEKIAYTKNGKPVTAIPKGHPLESVLHDLQHRIHRGTALQYALPMVLTSAGAEAMFPGAGLLQHALGGSAAGALFAHFAQPHLINFIKNPYVANLLNRGRQTVSGAGKTALQYDYNR